MKKKNNIRLKKDQEVKSVYGEKLTVMEVNYPMVRTYEDPSNLYHITKIIVKQ